MPRIGGAPGLARRLTTALLILASVTDACPFAGRGSGGSVGGASHHLQPAAAAAVSLPPSELAARARALLSTDLGADLGLAPGRERVFSGVAPAPPSPADLPGPLALSAVARPSALHIKLEEADGALPDAALIAKILSKNATTAKAVVARLADLEWQALAAAAVLESKKGVGAHLSAARDAAHQLLTDNKTAAAEAVARAVIEKLATPNQWGLLLRAAFHDAGSGPPGLASTAFTPGALPVGGADGSLRHELHWDSNSGVVGVWPVLSLAKKVLDAKFGEGVFSWADIIAIGGAAGVKAAGGPVMQVGYGRADAPGADPRTGPATDPAHAKDFSAPALLAAFADFGVGADATVVLMGAHAMGLAMLTAGSEGPLGPPKFTNFFYRVILAGKGSFVVDNNLATNAGTAPLVEAFSADQAAFFAAFEREYRAMTWWGQPPRAQLVG